MKTSFRSAAFALLTCVVLFASPRAVVAQSLQQQNEQILTELKAIRQLLERLAGPLGPGGAAPPAGAPTSDKVKLVGAITGFVLGKPDAPLTMVEFTDLQCPFCRQFHITTFEQLKKQYIDTGKLRFVSRDLPLPQLHPLAQAAAKASRCAGEEGKFWDMRHSILVNNASLTPDSFATFAQDLKLNPAAFKACVADPSRFQTELQKDLADAGSVGITGTPSFVIGRTTADGVDGVRLVGAQPFQAFDARLKDLLARP